MIDWPLEFTSIDSNDIESAGKLKVSNFKKFGFQILRNFLNSEEISNLLKLQGNASARMFHPVAHDLTQSDEIKALSQSMRRNISQRLTNLLGPSMGLTGARFLVKKPHCKDIVSAHQDVGYHIGSVDQISIFSALNEANKQNGGICVVPGSHHLGYLGDAGTLEDFYPKNVAICPDLNVGDALVMHCATIHFSGKNNTSSGRALFELLLCPEEQPWRIDTIASENEATSAFGQINPREVELFRSGRAQRLQKIRQILDER